MSKPLSSYNERERMLAISRRLKQGVADEGNRGLGFWSAFDAIRHYPAASLSLELRGTYLDIEKQLNKKRGGNHEGKNKSRKTIKRRREANVLHRHTATLQKVEKVAAFN